jgi:hypothetical protein
MFTDQGFLKNEKVVAQAYSVTASGNFRGQRVGQLECSKTRRTLTKCPYGFFSARKMHIGSWAHLQMRSASEVPTGLSLSLSL